MKLALGLKYIVSADTSLMVSKTVKNTVAIEFIYCACGCGKTGPKYIFDQNGNPRKNYGINKFIRGHFWRTMKHSEESKRKLSLGRIGKYKGKDNAFFGRKHTPEQIQRWRELQTGKKLSEETRKKMSISIKQGCKRGPDHYKWKGNDVGYHALHIWVKNRLPKPDLCQQCNNRPSEDLANITGIYSRDFNNWQYMCKKCHTRYDKIYERSLKPWQEKNKEAKLSSG